MKNYFRERERLCWISLFLIMAAAIVLIALFVRDRFVRPYLGDVIVTVCIYAFIRIFLSRSIKLLPLYVLLFTFAVEAAQYFNYVELLGLGSIRFFRIMLGTSFSHADLACYFAGAVISWGVEHTIAAYCKRG